MSFVADVFKDIGGIVSDQFQEGGVIRDAAEGIGGALESPAGAAILAMAGLPGTDFGFGAGSFSGGIDYGGLGGGFPGMGELASLAPGPGGGDIMAEIAKKYGLKQASPWSAALNIGSSLYGLKQSRDATKLAKEGMARMDPFGAQRPQYQQQLAALMANPSTITSMPGYKAGLDAVERKMASQGYLGSGNMMTALSDYGGNVFNQETARLAGLAGANIAPSGGSIGYQGVIAGNDAASKALASMGFGIKQIEQILKQPGVGA